MPKKGSAVAGCPLFCVPLLMQREYRCGERGGRERCANSRRSCGVGARRQTCLLRSVVAGTAKPACCG